MALYIDSAFLHDIMNAAQTVPVAGVTTNPTILLAERERGQDLSPQGVLEVLLRSTDGTIFMQPGASKEEEMYAEAFAYIQAAPDRVIPKIPMTHTGLRKALLYEAERQGTALPFRCNSQKYPTWENRHRYFVIALANFPTSFAVARLLCSTALVNVSRETFPGRSSLSVFRAYRVNS